MFFDSKSDDLCIGRELSRPSRLAIKVFDSDYHNKCSKLEIPRHLTTHKSNHPGYNHVLKLHDSFEIVEDNIKHICLVVGPGGTITSYTAKSIRWYFATTQGKATF